MQALRPRGHYDWEKVVVNYNRLTGESANYDRLHDRFWTLARTKKPTGKHTKPSHVQRAHEILDMIDARVFSGINDGDDSGDAIDHAAAALHLDEEEGKEEQAHASAASSTSPPPPARVSSPSLSSSASSSSSSPEPRRAPQSFPQSELVPSGRGRGRRYQRPCRR